MAVETLNRVRRARAGKLETLKVKGAGEADAGVHVCGEHGAGAIGRGRLDARLPGRQAAMTQIAKSAKKASPVQSYHRLAAALLAEFEAWLRSRDFSEHALRSYLFVIRSFLDFLRSGNPLDSAQIGHHYLAALMARRLSRRTIAHHTSVLREFFQHLKQRGLVEWHPMMALPPRQGYQRPLPRFLTEDEATRLIESTKGLRDRAILEFFYGTGCRVGELVQVQVEDLDFSEREVLLRGKGRKERRVPFGGKAAEALRAYLGSRSTGPVFMSRQQPDKPLSTRGIGRIVGKASLRAGLKHVNPHALRHSYATHLLNRGVDIRFVQELLGHASISTTTVYTHVALADLKKTHERCHPRG